MSWPYNGIILVGLLSNLLSAFQLWFVFVRLTQAQCISVCVVGAARSCIFACVFIVGHI
jgi:hypothetical protein